MSVYRLYVVASFVGVVFPAFSFDQVHFDGPANLASVKCSTAPL
jgi:hypothetical protein